MADGTTGVGLTHLIVRDCRVEGIAVRANGAADVVNATLAGNGTAVRAAGTARIKNSLFTDNGVAAAGEAAGRADQHLQRPLRQPEGLRRRRRRHRRLLDRRQLHAISPARDFRLAGPQRSTDKGDPADDVGDEPAPNGGRINLGAFGGTADAEPTAPSTSVGASTSPTAGPTQIPTTSSPTPTPKPPSQSPDDDDRPAAAASPQPPLAPPPSPSSRWPPSPSPSRAAARRNQREPAAPRGRPR